MHTGYITLHNSSKKLYNPYNIIRLKTHIMVYDPYNVIRPSIFSMYTNHITLYKPN
ncbi:hypothetical protein Hanom_Chr13g01200881 [Helianthus anomalus]